MKKKKVIVITGSVVAILLIIGVQFFADWYKFYSIDKSIKNVVSDIQRQYGLDNVTVEKYCTYGHQKFSRGSLDCTIDYMVRTSDNESHNILLKLISHDWNNKGSNLETVNSYSDKIYENYTLLNKDSFDCSLSILKQTEKIYNNRISCYGTALHEWYPVRD